MRQTANRKPKRKKTKKSRWMRHLSLFTGSGIGTLAAQQCGIETIAQCENDPACQFALRKLWPDTYLFEDIHGVSVKTLRQRGIVDIDIISGGFPCQDLSCAGKGAGIEGSRSGLWREMFRVIRQVRPTWIVVENVPAIRLRGVDRVIAPLERIGYTVWPLVVGAWLVGAPHKRDRVWIVARLEDSATARRTGTGPEQTNRRNGENCTGIGRDKGAGPCLAGEAGLANASDNRRGNATGEAIERGRGTAGTRTPNVPGREEWGTNQPNAIAGAASEDGRLADAPIIGEREPNDSTGPEPRKRTRQSSGRRSATVGHSIGNGLQGIGDNGEGSGEYAGSAAAGTDHQVRWPSRPGEPQHPWEQPRLIEQSLGYEFDGFPARVQRRANKAALRILGNAWCYQNALIIFRWIAEQEK